MKICYLTQTANDISDYYKDFFKNKDLFFVTFKTNNPNAIAFVPNSTWSDGRNKLWEELKNKYDYYVFMDDDLHFYNYNPKFSKSPFNSYIYYLFKLKRLMTCYQQSEPSYFFLKLEYYLKSYKPEVLAVTKVDGDPNKSLNALFMRRNSFVRSLGYFDAQFTVLSNYAASKILPYDNKISGWWSAQIPVYLYAFHVFGKKAINIIELGCANNYSTGGKYVQNYDGYLDCKTMLAKISNATDKDYTAMAGTTKKGLPINDIYGKEVIKSVDVSSTDVEDYKLNYNKSLKGLEHFLHENMLP